MGGLTAGSRGQSDPDQNRAPVTEDRPRGAAVGLAPGELRYLVLAAQREANRVYARMLTDTGLTPSQAEIMLVLHEFGPLSLRDLGGMIVCEAGSPSRVVDALVQRDLVERQSDPRDRRAVLLTLTARAEQLVPRLRELEGTMDAMTNQRLDAQQRTATAGALRGFLRGTRELEALERRFAAARTDPRADPSHPVTETA